MREIKIGDKSDILIVWNTKKYHCWKSLEKRGFDYEHDTKLWPSEVKRLWIYINEPENKLLYITKVSYHKEKKVSEDLWDCNECRNMMKELNNDPTLKVVYKLELLHKLSEGNSLPELQKYKHKDYPKRGFLFVPKPIRTPFYISSYPKLRVDIITGKVS